MIEEKCRVCGQFCLLTDAFCPTCGYEIHIYPSESKAMAEYEEMRAERYRKTWEALNESQAVSQRLEAENSKIQHKLDEKAQELKDKVAQNEKMDDQLKTLEKERNRLHSQIEEKQRDSNQLSNDMNAARHEKEKLDANLKEANNTILALQRQIDEIKTSIVHPIASLVMSQEGNITSIYNILEGENSFGYAKSNDRHQQIICNAQISDVHFSIRAISATDTKGRTRTKFFVTPRGGQIYGSSNSSNIINSERELEKNDSIFIDDIKFTLVANKNK